MPWTHAGWGSAGGGGVIPSKGWTADPEDHEPARATSPRPPPRCRRRVRCLSASPFTTPARAIEGSDWQHALRVAQNLRAHPPAEPVVLLLGGSAAREATVSDAAWASAVQAHRSDSPVFTYDLGSRNQTFEQDVALVEALPRIPVLVFIGVNLGRFTSPPTTTTSTTPKATKGTYTQHHYSSARIQSLERKEDGGPVLDAPALSGLLDALRHQPDTTRSAHRRVPGARLPPRPARIAAEHGGHRGGVRRADHAVSRRLSRARRRALDPVHRLRGRTWSSGTRTSTTWPTWSSRARPNSRAGSRARPRACWPSIACSPSPKRDGMAGPSPRKLGRSGRGSSRRRSLAWRSPYSVVASSCVVVRRRRRARRQRQAARR